MEHIFSSSPANLPLKGSIAVVAGAADGTGRGVALMLGEAGATVYCTAGSGNQAALLETAGLVSARGGAGVAVEVDHASPEQVQALFERIKRERAGLDILVNNLHADDLSQLFKPFWSASLEQGSKMLQSAIHSRIVTSHFAAPLMFERGRGLIVELTDSDTFFYRGNVFFDVVKTSIIRLAFAIGYELRKRNIAVVALAPGYVRSETLLRQFGVTEDNWKLAAPRDPNLMASESPFYAGRAVSALAADREVWKRTGRVFGVWDLAVEYNFTDLDGTRPNWARHCEMTYGRYKKCDEGFYSYCTPGLIDAAFPGWPE